MNLTVRHNFISGITPLNAAETACRLAADCPEVIIGSKYGDSLSMCVMDALKSGLVCGGSEVIDMGRCLETQIFHTSFMTGYKKSIYFSSQPEPGIYLRDRCIEVSEKKINKLLCKESSESCCGNILNGHIFKGLYNKYIHSIIPKDFPQGISVSSGADNIENLYGKGKDSIIIRLSDSGTKASVYTNSDGNISWEKLIMICCMEMFECGSNVALPFEFPWAADILASHYNKRVYRYFTNGEGYDDYSRSLAVTQRFSLDGLILSLMVLKFLDSISMSFSETLKKIPDFYVTKKFVPKSGVSINIPENFESSRGRSRILVSRSSGGVWLSAEGASMETAKEICGDVENFLLENSSDDINIWKKVLDNK